MKSTTDIQTILQETYQADWSNFRPTIEETSTYEKFLNEAKSKGVKNATQFAYEISCAIWDRDAQAAGLPGFNVPKTPDQHRAYIARIRAKFNCPK